MAIGTSVWNRFGTDAKDGFRKGGPSEKDHAQENSKAQCTTLNLRYMYVTIFQGDGRIGFFDAYDIKESLKGLGARWHSEEGLWIVTTHEKITDIVNKIETDELDWYRVGHTVELTGPQDRILFN